MVKKKFTQPQKNSQNIVNIIVDIIELLEKYASLHLTRKFKLKGKLNNNQK